MKISIGPIPAQWTRNDLMTFYDAVALSSVDVVYIGEALTTSRVGGVQHRDRFAIARELVSSGKEVVISIRLGNHGTGLSSQWKWIEEREYPIEADDARALALVANKCDFVVGPSIQCDGEHGLNELVKLGARRWVLPAVCKGEAMKALARAPSATCEIELPVVDPRQFSRWQCRVDQCTYNGLSAHSLSGCDLVSAWKAGMPDWAREMKALRGEGISVLRIVPRNLQAVEIAQILSDLARDEISGSEARARYVGVRRTVAS